METPVEVPARMTGLIKKTETESYVLEEMDVPQPRGDEVLVRVEAASICGSDLALYRWDAVARQIATIPFIPGHECAGTVVSAGPQACIQPGTRVAVENHFYCGTCYQCTHGRGDICANMAQYGHGRGTTQGACSQYSIVPAKYCYQLKTDISMDEAVLLEPLGVAHNAVEALGDVAGNDVLVIGAGPIGLLATSTARALGAKRVLAADIDPGRLQLAREMGAEVLINTKDEDIREVVMRETGGVGIGQVAEMSGAPAMANRMFSLLRKGGTAVMVGLVKQPLHVDNVLQDIIFKSLTLRTIHGRRIFHTWEESERLVSQGKVDVKKVISHRLPLSQFEDAFSALFSGQACKIILYPGQ